MKQIGLVTGGGTGPELARVFRNATEIFSQLTRQPTRVVACSHEFCSFTELAGLSQEACRKVVERDVRELTQFYKKFKGDGGRRLFRTAVNAETLYSVRRELNAVKVSHELLGSNRVSFFRDQFQGFYSNNSWRGDSETLTFEATFSRSALQRIYQFACAESTEWLGANPDVWFVYKHHLFANAFVEWIASICTNASVLQPGMAYSKLTERAASSSRPVLIIAGNEIGDMLQEVFIGFARNENRETAWSRNVYLHPSVEGLIEYQTVHGSADDIGGLGRVNPIATLRAASTIFGISAEMEQAIQAEPCQTSQPTEERARALVAHSSLIYEENNTSSLLAKSSA